MPTIRNKDATRRSIRGTALALVASALALTPIVQPTQTSAAGAQQGARTTITRQPNQSARPVAQAMDMGAALSNLLAMKNSGDQLFRDPGCPPHIWGQSGQCIRQSRKRRLHAKGISLSRM